MKNFYGTKTFFLKTKYVFMILLIPLAGLVDIFTKTLSTTSISFTMILTYLLCAYFVYLPLKTVNFIRTVEMIKSPYF